MIHSITHAKRLANHNTDHLHITKFQKQYQKQLIYLKVSKSKIRHYHENYHVKLITTVFVQEILK